MGQELLLSISEAYVTFGGAPLFEDLSFNINANDKICLVGKNGAGKSTLIKIISEDIELDGGKRWHKPGISIGYLEQDPIFDKNLSVHDYVLSGLDQDEQTEDQNYLVDIMLNPLQLDKNKIMGELSGGQIRRASLAKSLIATPDILLLDEPTNHMDIIAIEWLENFLRSFRGAIICISHDREFLKNISQKVFWLDRGSIRVCPKGYEYFEEWSLEMMEQEQRELVNRKKKEMLETQWESKGVRARRKRNIRRLHDLYAMREKLQADKASFNQTINTIKLDPISPVLASKIIVEFKDVSKSFTHKDVEQVILKDFNLRILRGDRIGILGKNGSGKSTFLKLLMSELAPDAGTIKIGKNVDISYFDQNRSDINPSKSLWETLCPNGGDMVQIGGDENRYRHVVGYLKDFLFDPKIAKDKVGTLSGGQKNRLMLAKILAEKSSFMVLDEPTNDLDMDTLDMLQEVLDNYAGTLFLVSHDRDFIDRIVSKTIVFEGNGVVEGYVGGYSDYIKQKNNSKSSNSKKSPSSDRGDSNINNIDTDKDNKKGKAANKPTKLSYKFQREWENLPEKISNLEKEVKEIQNLLADPDYYTNNKEEFYENTTKLEELQSSLDKSETRWLELEEMLEEINSNNGNK